MIMIMMIYEFVTSDKGGGKCVCPRLSVCLSVCLLARLLKNACMDLDEMLRDFMYICVLSCVLLVLALSRS